MITDIIVFTVGLLFYGLDMWLKDQNPKEGFINFVSRKWETEKKTVVQSMILYILGCVSIYSIEGCLPWLTVLAGNFSHDLINTTNNQINDPRGLKKQGE